MQTRNKQLKERGKLSRVEKERDSVSGAAAHTQEPSITCHGCVCGLRANTSVCCAVQVYYGMMMEQIADYDAKEESAAKRRKDVEKKVAQ
jgi:hypothetical protein